MNRGWEGAWTQSDESGEEAPLRPEETGGAWEEDWEGSRAADARVEDSDLWSDARTPRQWQARPDAEFRAEFDDFVEPDETGFPVTERFEDPGQWIERINPRWEGPDGPYGSNCADCARCVERTWRGHGEVAAGQLEDGESVERVEQWTGPLETVDGEGAISRLERGGPGSSAYVASTGEGWGHAYNLVNHEGEVLLVDGQDHRVESARGLLDGHDEFHLHPEAWHRAAFWDPEGEEL